MPWDFSKADLNGQIEFSLHKGRFSSLNSYSARLLELLSLQSVKRLARLDFNPPGLTREGFPYDDLRGTAKVERKTVVSGVRVTIRVDLSGYCHINQKKEITIEYN